MEKDKEKPTVHDIGKMGGTRTSETHGAEFYSEIGREGAKVRERNRNAGVAPKPKGSGGKMTAAEAGSKGGSKTAATHGREFYEEIGRIGGEKVSQERGPEFYSEIGHKGGQRVRRLIQEGKEHEEP